MNTTAEKPTLEIQNLCVSVPARGGRLNLISDVSMEIPAGKIVGIVGESGCGKSMTARAVMGLLKHPAEISGGHIVLEGRDIAGLSGREWCRVRGSLISMIFQEPMTSLNPVMKAGWQAAEAVMAHDGVSKAKARRRVLDIFREVGISEPEKRFMAYPHQLSGGLRQRVMIAMAMICHPRLLIADEPTTALDVTVEAQILRLMKNLCGGGTSILLISHNLGVIAQLCDYVYVMYAGRIVEQADIFTLFEHPEHPYTEGLLSAVASLRGREELLDTIPGGVPDLKNLPAGCPFAERCGACQDRCVTEAPDPVQTAPGHLVRCHLAGKS